MAVHHAKRSDVEAQQPPHVYRASLAVENRAIKPVIVFVYISLPNARHRYSADGSCSLHYRVIAPRSQRLAPRQEQCHF